MANSELKNMAFTFNMRSAPRRGPTSSDNWNDCLEEIKTDLANLSKEWNNKLVKIVTGLPNGSDDTGINAFVYGIDGNHCYVEHGVTSSSDDLTYYDSGNDRPVTLKEAFDSLHTRIDNINEDLQEEIANSAAALTNAEKAAIGWNIFDSTKTSSSTSLDGKSENNRLNIVQLARDLYGSGYSLDSDGAANLTNSVQAMVDALLELHNGNWSDDATLSHAGVSITLSQTGINDSATENDSFTGTPANLEEDLNQIRTQLKNAKGTTTWTTATTALYTGGADDLEGLLTNTAGTGTKSSSNPWGYDFSDLGGLSTALDEITSTVVGSGLPTDIPASQTAQDLMAWMIAADMKLSEQYFRRMETGVEGTGPWDVYHGRSAYPQVQLVQIDPSITDSGQYLYTVEHSDTDEFVVTIPSGVTLVSGVIISLW